MNAEDNNWSGIRAWPGLGLLVALTFLASGSASAQPADDEPDIYSANDFGGVGLLQTRTARFAPDGTFEAGASFVNPFRRYYINWQIFPWLEANFRYTDITNRPFDGQPFDLSQSQFLENIVRFRAGGTLLDRGFDIKARLWREGRIRPALAIGLQDALGTGLFGGEYVVASKRFRRLDVHLGLGWGYLGNRGFLPNPLKIFGGRFDQRNASVGNGGKPSLGNFFAGSRVALFGGFEYHLPLDGLSLKLEYNGSDPALETASGPLEEDLPIGVGVNYRPVRWFDMSLGWERGNALMLRTALRANFSDRGIGKKDPVQPAAKPRAVPEGELGLIAESLDLTRAGRADLDALYLELEDSGIIVASLEMDPTAGTLRAAPAQGGAGTGAWPVAAAAILFRYLPSSVNQVTIYSLAGGGSAGARLYTRSGLRLASDLDKGSAYGTGEAGDFAAIILSAGHMDIRLLGAMRAEAGRDRPNIPDLALAHIRSVTVHADGALLYEADYLALVAESQAEELFGYLATADVDAGAVILEDGHLEVLSDKRGGQAPAKSGRALNLLAEGAGVRRISVVGAEGRSPGLRGSDTALSLKTTAARIFRDLREVGYTGYSLEADGVEAEIIVSKTRYLQVPRNVGWVSKIAARHLPPEIGLITVVQLEEGAEVSRVSLLRDDLERYDAGRGSPEETWANANIARPRPGPGVSEDGVVNSAAYPEYEWWLRPVLLQHIGDPGSGVYAADVNLALGGSVSLLPGLRLTAEGRRFLAGNLDRIERQSDSSLPRVRSDIVQYLQQGRTAISKLQVDYIGLLRPDLYFRASAGLFESMFGGFGAEILYRPYDTRWAVGADLNWVKQRDFDQLLDFRDYEVLTGHLSLYYDWPFYDVRTVVSAGRYLAGDYGVTIDVSRRFKSGVRVGAFATLTDVGFEEFGEGSFDKAFYVTLPLDLLLPVSTRQRNTFLFRPLTRDGGQRLSVGPRLFELVDDTSELALRRDWGRIFD